MANKIKTVYKMPMLGFRTLVYEVNKHYDDYYVAEVEKIGAAVAHYIERDRSLRAFIEKPIIERMKYSTGNLLQSLTIKAKYFGEEGAILVRIEADIGRNPSLANALYGEAEQLPEKLPTIENLAKWVRGKRRLFREEITAFTKRRREAHRIVAMRRQRAFLEGMHASKYAGERLHLPSYSEDPVRELARVIQSRMRLRMEWKNLPPTKGSEYVMVGNYPEYDDEGSFRARYHKQEPPLVTRFSEDGVINKIVGQFLEKDVNNILRMYLDKEPYTVNKTYKEIAMGLLGISKKSKRRYTVFVTMLNRTDKLFDKLRSIGRRQSSDIRHFKGVANLAIDRSHHLYSEFILDQRKLVGREFNLELKKNLAGINELIKYKVKLHSGDIIK